MVVPLTHVGIHHHIVKVWHPCSHFSAAISHHEGFTETHSSFQGHLDQKDAPELIFPSAEHRQDSQLL